MFTDLITDSSIKYDDWLLRFQGQLMTLHELIERCILQESFLTTKKRRLHSFEKRTHEDKRSIFFQEKNRHLSSENMKSITSEDQLPLLAVTVSLTNQHIPFLCLRAFKIMS